ncbi:MAG: hypothetical protein QXI89_00580 [Candidatus Anstonellales archaeon]
MLDTYKKQAEALAKLPLEELIDMEEQFEVELERTNREAERLEKKLRVVKQELKEYKEASKKLNKPFEDTPFYEHLVNFLEETEKFLENVKIKNGELISLLYAIAIRIKKDKKGKEVGRFKPE